MTIQEANEDRLAWIEKKAENASYFDSIGEGELADDERRSMARFSAMSNEDFIQFVEAQQAFIPKMRSGLLPV